MTRILAVHLTAEPPAPPPRALPPGLLRRAR